MHGPCGDDAGQEIVTRYLAKNGNELRVFLSKVNAPSNKNYRGNIYKSLSNNSVDKYAAKPNIISEYSIDNAWGRFDINAESASYFSKTLSGNKTEITYYGDWNDYYTCEYKNVNIDGLLDLTDDQIRQQLGVNLDHLTMILLQGMQQ